MKTFEVTVRHINVELLIYHVEADDLEDARQRLNDGEGEIVDTDSDLT